MRTNDDSKISFNTERVGVVVSAKFGYDATHHLAGTETSLMERSQILTLCSNSLHRLSGFSSVVFSEQNIFFRLYFKLLTILAISQVVR